MIAYDDVERIVGAHLDNTKRAPYLIAIDGRPLSGKSTTTAKLEARFGLASLAYDDFFAGQDSWDGKTPAFPYPFFRHHEFVEAVGALRRDRACVYRPYDWEASALAEEMRGVEFDAPLIIEGCAVLDANLAPLYDLKFWIESDAGTSFDAAMARDGEHWRREWREMFLPSVEIYMATNPSARADHIVAGRGDRV